MKLLSSRIIYKLLFDILFILVLFFTLALIADGLVPGIISEHFGFYAVAILIIANVFAIDFLSQKYPSENKLIQNKRAAVIFSLVMILLIINSLLKAGWILMLIILFLIFCVAYLIYKMLTEQ